MSIYFRNTPVSAPFMFESLGNHWNQVNIFRPDGYPYYHYLQTEKGTGRIEVRGKFYTLGANEGILIAPGVPHSYHRESTSWTTMFATFTGTLAGSIPSMTDNQEVILVEKEQGANIRKMISSTLRKYHQPTPDMKSLSSDCYNFLMNFTDCAASPKIQDNPLYQRYVIPVIKEIETGYQQDITAAQLSSTEECDWGCGLTRDCTLSRAWLRRIRSSVRYFWTPAPTSSPTAWASAPLEVSIFVVGKVNQG